MFKGESGVNATTLPARQTASQAVYLWSTYLHKFCHSAVFTVGTPKESVCAMYIADVVTEAALDQTRVLRHDGVSRSKGIARSSRDGQVKPAFFEALKIHFPQHARETKYPISVSLLILYSLSHWGRAGEGYSPQLPVHGASAPMQAERVLRDPRRNPRRR